MIRIVVLLLVAALAGCGGGAGGDGGPTLTAPGCTGGCAAATPTALTVAEVNRILSQAVQEALARGALGTIAVVDRPGNVLAVFKMTGAGGFTISGGRGVVGGLEGVNIVPPEYAAISKAITGAYLSSEGNAFSTRTASQIVQENFNPGETGSPGGPLFGVQFSSLSCSDVVATGPTAGPKPSPLGLSADPGGLPLYKNGIVVGGIGVIADGVYGLDLDIRDVDHDLDELIAVAGARGFDAPVNRRADHITADGRTFRYVDSEAIVSDPAAAPAAPGSGAFISAGAYYAGGGARAGVAFSTAASGFRLDATTPEFSGLGAYVLDNGAGANRFPPIAGSDGLLTQAEVTRIMAEAMRIANRARAQIRQPLGLSAQVTISVVDTNAAILGVIRTPDAPIFGTDVAIQKARSALLFTKPNAAALLNALPPNVFPPTLSISTYVASMQALIPGALTNGIAYSNRAIGNLARPFLPDGINGNGPGPLSRPFAQWSPFAVGLQLDLVQAKIVGNILAGTNTGPCSTVPEAANGIQIFPGSVPIYRGNVMVGAIGVSGDGIDQDDMVSFLGLANAGIALGTGIANAPAAQRADQIAVPGGQLRYVNCPAAPFLDTAATNVCDGI
ncbi:MAG: heme-binding protein [Burkholderiales bacterium]|nr:heme-binding protein [Burkholderiales bacterium]